MTIRQTSHEFTVLLTHVCTIVDSQSCTHTAGCEPTQNNIHKFSNYTLRVQNNESYKTLKYVTIITIICTHMYIQELVLGCIALSDYE